MTLNNGAELVVNASGYAANTIINDGGILNVEKQGEAYGTTLNTGGVQNIQQGATVSGTNFAGGTQNVLAGAYLEGESNSNGIQNIYGSVYNSTVRSDGWMNIKDGGVADFIKVDGSGNLAAYKGSKLTDITVYSKSTVFLENDVNIDELKVAEAGNIRLFKSDADDVANLETYNIKQLKTGGKGANIYVSDGKSAVGRELTIDAIDGSGNFMINTDLASGKTDHITINKATNSQHNTLAIQYDPSADLGQVIKGERPVEVVSTKDDMNFKAAEEQIGAYSYIPVLTKKDGNWFVDRIELTGTSDMAKYSSGLVGYNLALMRDSDQSIDSRMFNLRNAGEKEGFWMSIDGSKQKVANENLMIKGNYTGILAGYDKKIAKKTGTLFLGGVFDYIKGSASAGASDSDNKGFMLGTYGSWIGNNNQFVNFDLRGGKINTDYSFVKASGINGISDGKFSNTGFALSTAYGVRKPFSQTWYVEPTVKLAYTKLNGDDYMTSDNVAVSQNGSDSLIGKLGFRVGTKIPGGELYVRAAYAKDFSGDYGMNMNSNGLGNKMVSSSLAESWFEYGVGFKQNFNNGQSWYAEVEKMGATGDAVVRDMRYQAGLSFTF